jgi:hypothetical protein
MMTTIMPMTTTTITQVTTIMSATTPGTPLPI